jgi:hypothetical protein
MKTQILLAIAPDNIPKLVADITFYLLIAIFLIWLIAKMLQK